MRRTVPSTSALLAFEAAARHESFTRAAQELSLTQGAVCRQVAALEAHLGLALFHRNRRGVGLTEAGASYARQIAARLDALERDTLAVMARQGAGATLSLAVVPTFATRWLMPRLPDFRRAHPEVVVNFETRTRPFLFDDTEFDAAIHFGDAGWPGTEAHFLMPEAPLAVFSPRLVKGRQRLRPQDLLDLPLLQQSTRPYAWREWFAAQGLRAPHDMSGARMELFSMLSEAAIQGLGVSLIPAMFIEDELRSGRLVAVQGKPSVSTKGYFFIVPQRKSSLKTVEDFRAWLLAQASDASAPRRQG